MSRITSILVIAFTIAIPEIITAFGDGGGFDPGLGDGDDGNIIISREQFGDRRGDLDEDDVTGDIARRRGVYTCISSGDPHIMGYSGNWYHVQTACRFTMSRDGCSGGSILTAEPSKFHISAEFYRRDPNKPAAWNRRVIIELPSLGLVVEMELDKTVKVNGAVTSVPVALANGAVYIGSSYNGVFLSALDIGIQVIWNGNQLQIIANEGYAGKLCGLCGDFGFGNAEFGHGPSTDCATGSSTDLIDSWQYDSAECGQCTDEEDECDDDAAAAAACDAITDPVTAREAFQDCISTMNQQSPEILAEFRRSCIYDVCQAGSDVCDLAHDLVMLCQYQFSIRIDNWRDPNFCPLDCPQNSHYTTCANPCESDTCPADAADGCFSADACEEGCSCDEGYFWDFENELCVPSCDPSTTTTTTTPATTTTTPSTTTTTPTTSTSPISTTTTPPTTTTTPTSTTTIPTTTTTATTTTTTTPTTTTTTPTTTTTTPTTTITTPTTTTTTPTTTTTTPTTTTTTPTTTTSPTTTTAPTTTTTTPITTTTTPTTTTTTPTTTTTTPTTTTTTPTTTTSPTTTTAPTTTTTTPTTTTTTPTTTTTTPTTTTTTPTTTTTTPTTTTTTPTTATTTPTTTTSPTTTTTRTTTTTTPTTTTTTPTTTTTTPTTTTTTPTTITTTPTITTTTPTITTTTPTTTTTTPSTTTTTPRTTTSTPATTTTASTTTSNSFTTTTTTTTPAGTCRCYGDPHCTTADGFYFNLTMASCGMTFLRDGCQGGIPTGSENSYEVAVDIDSSGKHWFVEGLRIVTGGHSLEMDSTPLVVTVDGTQVAQQAIEGSTKNNPFVKYDYTMYRTATKRVMIVCCGGVHVEWNFNRRVKAEIPSSQASRTCGICGNSDGNPYNDYVFGPSDYDNRCPAKSGNMLYYGVQAGDRVGMGDKYSRLYALSWYSYKRPGDEACAGSCQELI